MDVNEIIVREWLQFCKNQFTIEDIKFKVYGSKGGSNYGNIDILSTDGKNYYDYEVKWRSAWKIPNTQQGDESINSFIEQIFNKPREAKIREYTKGKKCNHILVIHRQMLTKKGEDSAIMKFKKKGIQILYFEDIINQLKDKIEELGRYDSEVKQIIRMLKIYRIIAPNPKV
ncbi:MAG: hypothetical protein KGJ87_09155 [Planctomycetota bacterium]|nr:hypothetical protein [Planctomycetota bacterium]